MSLLRCGQEVQRENSLTLSGDIGEDILEEIPCELALEVWVEVDRLRKILWSGLDCERSTAMSGCQTGRKEDEEGTMC